VLVEHGIPLPEALRLAGDAARDELMARDSRELARRTEHGERFSEALKGLQQFPPTLKPVVRWGEATGSLAVALRTAGDMFASRLDLQSRLVRIVAGPITFLAVALIAMGVIGALMYPLISLIRSLTGQA
jgi:type II secretory pathway component PulF